MRIFGRTFLYRLKTCLVTARGLVSLCLGLAIAIIPFIGLSIPDAPVPIGWIDEDNTEFSALLKEKVLGIELLSVSDQDEQTLLSRLQTGDLEGVFIVPEGFEESMKAGEYEESLVILSSPYSSAFEIVAESVGRKAMEIWIACYTANIALEHGDKSDYDAVFAKVMQGEYEPILTLSQLSGTTHIPVDETKPIEEAAYTSLYLLAAFACFYMLMGLAAQNNIDFSARLISRAVSLESHRMALSLGDALFLLPCVIPSLIAFGIAGKFDTIAPALALFALYLVSYGGISSLVSKIKNKTTLMLTISLITIVNLFLGAMLVDLPAAGFISNASYILPSRWLSSADTLGVGWSILGMFACAAVYNALPFVSRKKAV
ncbi:MAG: ABC transporter permease [Clostridia bacterium]|nr:ABC transporter permease [Clostridia bacterium]